MKLLLSARDVAISQDENGFQRLQVKTVFPKKFTCEGGGHPYPLPKGHRDGRKMARLPASH